MVNQKSRERERSIKEWPSLAAGLLYSEVYGMGNKKDLGVE